ncbi:MAG TPA: hypothetical protein VMZ30_22740 [Pyrinomonadaceae bacterium]|nr:hypothetical protein [Pyrinomonadaceae bacterium]
MAALILFTSANFGNWMRLHLFLVKRRVSHLVAVAVFVIASLGTIAQSQAAQSQAPTPAQPSNVAGSPSPTPQSTTDWYKTIDSSQKLITALGIIIGGIWAWLKFFRGRTFRSRLELTVSGKIITSGTNKFLKATMEMKNVGLSQVKLRGDAIYLDVFLIDATTVKRAERLYSASWSEPVTFAVFKDHGWVEPSEEISDELLFQLPVGEQLACKLKLTVNSQGNSWIFFETPGTRWSATTIVDCAPSALANESATKDKGEKS